MARNNFWDYIKGLTILMVIIGHQIQFSTGNGVFFDDPIFQFIYSFHMPLFMFVSGFFFYNSVNKHSTIAIIKNKTIQLILPILTFTLTSFLLSDINSFGTLWDNGPQNISNLFTGDFSKKTLMFDFLKNLWFLWIVFYLSIFVIVVRSFLKDSIWIYLLVFLALFFSPDYYICNMFCFMYPYFVAGYLINKQEMFKTVFCNNKPIIGYSVIVLFIILLIFYNRNTYIYITGYCIIGKQNQLLYDTHRLIIGCLGVYSIIWLFYMHKNTGLKVPLLIRKGFLYLGRNTKQLYIITSLPIFINILSRFATGEVNYLKSIIATIVVTLVSILVIELIKKIKLANLIIFGQWNSNK